MRLLIQRVKEAHVDVAKKRVGSIQEGLLVFFGAKKGDSLSQVAPLAKKLLSLRVFPDDKGKMNLSSLDLKKELLIVSQFTLYANCQSGNRPSFTEALEPSLAKELYEAFVIELKKQPLKVETGLFQEMMEVFLINDGPATFLLTLD